MKIQAAALLGLAIVPLVRGQLALYGSGPSGNVILQNADLAVLEAGEDRKDLQCTVDKETKAVLGFDLRFHVTYSVSVPLKELSGGDSILSVLFRVTPVDRPGEPKYFSQRIEVPPIDEGSKGDTEMVGAFDVGEGKYRVSWLMRDRAEHVCAYSWDVEAVLPEKDKQIAVALQPGAIEAFQPEQFLEEPAVSRAASDGLLNVKVLMNIAPQRKESAALRPMDTSALVAILRMISREPNIGKFTLVAFNLQDQKVVYRQTNVDKINFPALGKSLGSIKPASVDVAHLAQKHGDTEFLAGLINSEFGPSTSTDAMIFAGPKAILEQQIDKEDLPDLKSVDYPVFYMNYTVNPEAAPWRDTIGNAVKALKGVEYTISKPRDLWFAVGEMVSKITKTRNAKQLASVSK